MAERICPCHLWCDTAGCCQPGAGKYSGPTTGRIPQPPDYQQLPRDPIEGLVGLSEAAAQYLEGESSWETFEAIAKAARRKRIREAKQGE